MSSTDQLISFDEDSFSIVIYSMNEFLDYKSEFTLTVDATAGSILNSDFYAEVQLEIGIATPVFLSSFPTLYDVYVDEKLSIQLPEVGYAVDGVD